jgi:hypothetical protein
MFQMFSKNPQDVNQFEEKEEYIPNNETILFENPFYHNTIEFGNTTYEEFVYEDTLPKYELDPLGINSLQEEEKESLETMEMTNPVQEEISEEDTETTFPLHKSNSFEKISNSDTSSSLHKSNSFEKISNSDTSSSLHKSNSFEKISNSDTESDDDFPEDNKTFLDIIFTFIRTTSKIVYYHFIAGVHYLRENISYERLKKA